METLQFKETLEVLDRCSSYQFRIVQQKIETIKANKCVSVELEISINNLVCPHCSSIHFQRCG